MANMALTHVPISAHVRGEEPTVYKANCGPHQWAVADGNREAVQALVREHVREHPSVHCPSPPDLPWGSPPLGTEARVHTKLQTFLWTDGSVTYCGQCGMCSPGWAILHSHTPVDALMHEHWVTAHASDYEQEHHG